MTNSKQNPGDKEVVVILSQVLADLVQWEFMQLQNKDDESERLEI